MTKMLEPFLKWPGGKRWLASRHADLFPPCYERYIEPFLGGGAVFFRLGAKSALLSDANEELINAYRSIKENPDAVDRLLNDYQVEHSPSFYYRMRETLAGDPLTRAARFIYLNRTCFNGMYRVNRQGAFNVPIGTKSAVAFTQGYLQRISDALSTADIVRADFEDSIGKAQDGDFVFVDPPYTVMHNNNGFIKYNAKLFSWEDQKRLASAVRDASARGAMVLVTNADHSDVRHLYEGLGQQLQIKRASVLAAGAERRRSTTELMVRTYVHGLGSASRG